MISVNGVSVSLGRRRVVDGVSLTLAAGHFVALTGPNGAGKSTLMKAMAGGLALEAGEVCLGREALSSLSVAQRARRVAWLPQTRPVAWNLDAEDVVALGRFVEAPQAYARMPDSGKAAVDAALVKADAAHLKGRAYQALSGGEQARVHLARLLASPAPVLLLDEPCAALDIVHQLSLMETLAQEAAGGRTVLVVLHDLELATRFCPRIVVMQDGRKVADGTPETALSADVLAQVFGVARAEGGRLTRRSKDEQAGRAG
ncbi:MAG: ABC transporter ATP-binding protein [Hyphomonas sp.]|jgi:iron complex transport system ATP-binding protein